MQAQMKAKETVNAIAGDRSPLMRRARTGTSAVLWAAALLVTLSLAAAALSRPEWRTQHVPDWRPLVERANAAVSGDRYQARHLYVDAARAASWDEDWQGLLAAACGMKKVDGPARAHANTYSILVRAMTVAESARSRAGLQAVSGALSAIGENEVAASLLARARPEWPEEAPPPRDSAAADCWGNQAPIASGEDVPR
jgi:hypothetical protein